MRHEDKNHPNLFILRWTRRHHTFLRSLSGNIRLLVILLSLVEYKYANWLSNLSYKTSGKEANHFWNKIPYLQAKVIQWKQFCISSFLMELKFKLIIEKYICEWKDMENKFDKFCFLYDALQTIKSFSVTLVKIWNVAWQCTVCGSMKGIDGWT